MTVTAIAERPAQPTLDPKAVAAVLLHGDLEKLNDEQRIAYCHRVCDTLGLNPLTQPFAFIKLNGKLRMYALKDATEQLRKIHGVSITDITSTRVEDVFVVTAKAQDRTGRTDSATGAVAIANLKGESLANALMKAETKAKRRATLSICGLGMLDETEAADIPQPLVVETPPQARRGPLPDGCFYIVAAKVKQWGGDITILDGNGVEATYPTPDRQSAELAEQIAQEDPAVPVTVERVIGKRDGVEKIKAVHRYQANAPTPTPVLLTDKDVGF